MKHWTTEPRVFRPGFGWPVDLSRDRQSNCTGCGAPIYWVKIRTKDGKVKPHPLSEASAKRDGGEGLPQFPLRGLPASRKVPMIRDRHGWPLERFEGRPLTNAMRVLLHGHAFGLALGPALLWALLFFAALAWSLSCTRVEHRTRTVAPPEITGDYVVSWAGAPGAATIGEESIVFQGFPCDAGAAGSIGGAWALEEDGDFAAEVKTLDGTTRILVLGVFDGQARGRYEADVLGERCELGEVTLTRAK